MQLLHAGLKFMCVCVPRQPQNVLLTSAQPLGDIRIVDFGLSRRVDSTSEVREILGTPEYVGESMMEYFTRLLCCPISFGFGSNRLIMFLLAAPEILSYEPISTATDMW